MTSQTEERYGYYRQHCGAWFGPRDRNFGKEALMERDEVDRVVTQMNNYVQERPWFDLEVAEYKGYRLEIMGGIDPSAPPEIEVWFQDVSFVSLPIEWRTDTATPALSVLDGDEALEVNRRFQVERRHFLFEFRAEGFPGDFGCLIGAKQIGFRVVS